MFARLKNLLLGLLITTALILGAEGVSRLVHPVHPVEMLDAKGKRIPKMSNTAVTLEPGARYRVHSNEFDAWTSHNALGFRGPDAATDPDIIFIGDSYTFGMGVADHETFPHVYCEARGARCINLARPASGTLEQLDVLSHALDTYPWTPGEVRLFLLGSTRAIGYPSPMSGNDLGDNLIYLNRQAAANREPADAERRAPTTSSDDTGWMAWLVAQRGHLINASNLVRSIYFMAAPTLRMHLIPAPDPAMTQAALEATRKGLDGFRALAQARGFTLKVYLLHPQEDLRLGTAAASYEAIRKLLPDGELIDTAPAFPTDASIDEGYFSYDGHLTPRGSAAIARFLLDNENTRSEQ